MSRPIFLLNPSSLPVYNCLNRTDNHFSDIVLLSKTREEIGSILGFSIRTINRNLKLLKEENLISVSRKGITITKEQFYKLIDKLEKVK